MAAAVLMEHYRAERGKAVTPNKLAEKLNDIEELSLVYRHFQFDCYSPYSEDRLYDLYQAGHPCAVLARPGEKDAPVWLPVVFLDEDGGIVYNRNNDEVFISEFAEVQKICSFNIR